LEQAQTLKIVTGGQSGVDRAALDAAIALGLPYGGWTPKGGWAEDFPEPPGLLAHYPRLRDTPGADPAQRTEWNIRDADAVLILLPCSGLAASKGTALARDFARHYGKPLLMLGLEDPEALARGREWLARLAAGRDPARPFALGIGGPRESESPGIRKAAAEMLLALLG
jgi:hypothetical protein